MQCPGAEHSPRQLMGVIFHRYHFISDIFSTPAAGCNEPSSIGSILGTAQQPSPIETSGAGNKQPHTAAWQSTRKRCAAIYAWL